MDYQTVDKSILYEDNHIIAINKPAGILVQGDNTGDKPLNEYVKAYIKEREAKPGNVFCGVIHRIDRPVSGIVILAKTSKGLAKMNELFREDNIKKTYQALVFPEPSEKSKVLINYLRKNSKTHKADVFVKEVANSKLSELSYEMMNKIGNYALLKVNPVTGRFHQIRAQLSYNKTPIVGDLKYGFKKPNPDKSICLHASEIEFIHPISKQNIKISCDSNFKF